MAKLAIIAGRDDLPRMLAEHRKAGAEPYLVVSFQQDTQPWMAEHPHQEHLFEKPGRLFRALREADVQEVVFAGRMARPKLRPWLFDAGALKIVSHVRELLKKGDDGLLSGLASIFESEGFRMRGAHEILAGLTKSSGVLGEAEPQPGPLADARLAARILKTLGPLDVGQAVVVEAGQCLGIETLGGTDRLLRQVSQLPPELRPEKGQGVLVKLPKPQQDLRVDLPSIGVNTVKQAFKAGLAGIVIAADGTNLIDRDGVIAEANRRGLFLLSSAGDEL